MNGILIVDKPEGLTSAEVVRRVKRKARVKVGHLGTLDPFATGVLPVCLGEATKIAQFLNAADKRYEGVIRLGVATDSGDRTGTVVGAAPLPALDDGLLAETAARFTGTILQIPPMHSALKRDGVPLYRLARRGIEVERPARSVRIDLLRLAPLGRERLSFEVACSKGTYVRVLAEDLGRALGSLAHLESLRRIAFGPFGIERAISLDDWEPCGGTGLVSLREALAHLPSVRLNVGDADAARQGKPWVLARVPAAGRADATVLLAPDESVAAVLVRQGERWAYGRVIRGAEALQPRDPVLGTRSNKMEERWG